MNATILHRIEGNARLKEDISLGDVEYISASEVAKKLSVSKSTVFRLARHEGIDRIYLGQGRNSTVRFLRTQILDLIERRTIRGTT